MYKCMGLFTSAVRLKDIVTFDCKSCVEQRSQSVVDEMTEEATVVLLLIDQKQCGREAYQNNHEVIVIEITF